MIRADVIVLGAGMAGVSAALHLQQRGRAVALIDRRGPGEETSYGNAGIIQREGVVPYPFPRDPVLLFKYAFNLLPEANLHWSALPRIAPWLYRYWRASTPARHRGHGTGHAPAGGALHLEHEALMEPAGVLGLVRRTGYLRVYRSAAGAGRRLCEGRGRPRDLRRQLPGARPGAGGRPGAAPAGMRSSAAC